jgi:hypothetical protein
MFEIRDMNDLIYFLEVRIIQDNKIDTIHLIQDAYINKLIKKYEIENELKESKTSLNLKELRSYESEINSTRMHFNKKKMKSICYLEKTTRSDITKSAFKLVEFLIYSSSQHMRVANHCLRY